MPALLMLHNSTQTALTWRAVADALPPLWAIAAPDLHQIARRSAAQDSAINSPAHRAQKQVAAPSPAILQNLSQLIKRDLDLVAITQPVVIIAAGNAAIPALAYATAFPAQVKALFLTEPEFQVTARQVQLAKIKARFAPRKSVAPAVSPARIPSADPTQETAYLQMCHALGAQNFTKIAAQNLPVRILVAAKERKIGRQAEQLAQRYPNVAYFPIAGATRGWNEFAPVQYAANITEFIAASL